MNTESGLILKAEEYQNLNQPEDHVILVDCQDQILGTEEKLKVHQLGLLHRAFSVFIYRRFEDSIELLLQQRQADKYHCGGLWSNACCSHPRINESVVMAGQRRLREELSFSVDLQQIGVFIYRADFDNGLIEHEVDHVLLGEYIDDTLISAVPTEVQATRWIDLEALKIDLALSPKRYTPWFRPALQFVMETLCRS